MVFFVDPINDEKLIAVIILRDITYGSPKYDIKYYRMLNLQNSEKGECC